MSRHINLLDESMQPAKGPLASLVLAGCVFLTVLAMGVWAAMAGWHAQGVVKELAQIEEQMRPVQQSLSELQAQQGTQKVNVQLQASIEEATAQLAARREIRDAVQRGDLGSTAGFSPVLRALARRTVPGVWLTGVSLEQGSRNLVLRGQAVDAARVAQLMQVLGEDEALSGLGIAGLAVRVEARNAGGSFSFVAAGTPEAASAQAEQEGRTP